MSTLMARLPPPQRRHRIPQPKRNMIIPYIPKPQLDTTHILGQRTRSQTMRRSQPIQILIPRREQNRREGIVSAVPVHAHTPESEQEAAERDARSDEVHRHEGLVVIVVDVVVILVPHVFVQPDAVRAGAEDAHGEVVRELLECPGDVSSRAGGSVESELFRIQCARGLEIRAFRDTAAREGGLGAEDAATGPQLCGEQAAQGEEHGLVCASAGREVGGLRDGAVVCRGNVLDGADAEDMCLLLAMVLDGVVAHVIRREVGLIRHVPEVAGDVPVNRADEDVIIRQLIHRSFVVVIMQGQIRVVPGLLERIVERSRVAHDGVLDCIREIQTLEGRSIRCEAV